VKPDIIIHENVLGFKLTLLQDVFQPPDFHVASRQFSPCDLGFPCNRPRIYSVVHDAQATVLTMNYDSTMFERFAYFDVVADANLYYRHPLGAEDVGILVDLAEKNGRVLPPDFQEQGVSYAEYLAGPHKVRLAGYTDAMVKKGEAGFICNLFQRPSHSEAVVKYVPTLLRTSTLYNMRLNRLTVPREYCAVMGVPCGTAHSTVDSMLVEVSGELFLIFRCLVGDCHR
jgi:hypothetical protein